MNDLYLVWHLASPGSTLEEGEETNKTKHLARRDSNPRTYAPKASIVTARLSRHASRTRICGNRVDMATEMSERRRMKESGKGK